VNGGVLEAPVVAKRGGAVLYRLDERPIRLREALIGRESDGWIVAPPGEKTARAAYTRYGVSGDGPGFAVVKLSRVGWCPSPGRRGTGRVTARIGPVAIGPDKQPSIGRVTDKRTFLVKDCQANGALLSAPDSPWRVEVEVTPTFSPHELDPSKSDQRELGGVLTVDFQPLFG